MFIARLHLVMIEIGDTLISGEFLEEEFVCNLSACQGACCVEGDAGAPLTQEEADLLQNELPNIIQYLPKKGQEAIKKQGVAIADPLDEDELVTPLVNGQECAFTVFDERGIASCGIEKAWNDGATSFRKPISCHLYPARLKDYQDFTAVNYHRWDICSDACSLGAELKVPVYRFLKDALIRRFGEKWYQELERIAAEEYTD